MKISNLSADEAILAQLGSRLAQRRIDQRLTQVEVAERAGIAKRTVERIESGASAQMSSLIRLLRVLDALPGLEQMLPETGPRPMDLLKRKGKLRQRASRRNVKKQAEKPWTWDDES